MSSPQIKSRATLFNQARNLESWAIQELLRRIESNIICNSYVCGYPSLDIEQDVRLAIVKDVVSNGKCIYATDTSCLHDAEARVQAWTRTFIRNAAANAHRKYRHWRDEVAESTLVQDPDS